MNRIVGVWLFTYLSFLLWIYLAANHSTVDDWWTVKTINEITSKEDDITSIRPIHFTSPIKVLIGSMVFLLIGILLSFIAVKRLNYMLWRRKY
ncbi:hypothetical protein [Sporosarcina highlanderae]|uniref:DUF4306 domain-containing protein n=1 Tax=Sporosarcina highlanderae TaxID=3035916 RepID=A0ABT8JUC9_9BACL|nr:hypothetical protein [Sporosarcina highlanderae]MDN4608765.1 hypothetical protein [Sporosarcina highlanderae]